MIIPVQTPFLRMTSLGVKDPPVDPADPHDLEGPGIHLRWAFPTRWPDGSTVPLGWPEAGFTVYRRRSTLPRFNDAFGLPRTARNIRPDGTLAVAGDAQLEFDPEAVAATLAQFPQAIDDLDRFVDLYPLYVTLRFATPVRMVILRLVDRPHQGDLRTGVVRAHYGNDAVDETTVVGDTGPAGVQRLVAADHITHLRIRLDGLAIDAVTTVVSPLRTDLDEWTRIAVLPPLRRWAEVRDRIPTGLHPAYEPGWGDLAAELDRLFDPADDRPRWLREFTDTGRPAGRRLEPGEVAPTWTYGLQPQILLFTIDPATARLLGLLFADTGPDAAGGLPFDYLVVGTFEVPGAGPTPASPGPTLLPGPPPDPFPPGGPAASDVPAVELPPPGGTVGWITYGCSSLLAPPLVPPRMTRAEPTPARTFLPDPATGALTEQARVGLAWTLRPEGAGGMLDTGSVRYDVEVRPDGAAGWASLTPAAAVVVTAVPDELGVPVPPAHFLHDRRGAGTHEWRVRAIDVFGRRSAPSAPITATIVDTVGPPPPVNVWAKYLDPDDPHLADDERPLGRGLLLRFDYPRRPYEAGSDAATFRLYTKLRSQDRALDWHDPGTWDGSIVAAPWQRKATGRATGARPLTGPDPAVRRFRVDTGISGGTGGGTAGQATWQLRRGHLLVGTQEYPVETVEPGPATAFIVAWPGVLGLPDPVPGPCTWYPGYQVFLANFPLDLQGAPRMPATAGIGATDRAGNRGRVSASVAFERVDRSRPAPPGVFDVGVDELLATVPDAHGRSRFTLTWRPATDGSPHHVYRALDAAVLARHGMTVADGRALDAAALRALADDPVAEPAFGQLTSTPVAGTSYVDSSLRGFGTNRYLYRLRPVSEAGVAGDLGGSTPPVAIPDVVPPRRPRIVRALGGDGSVTVTFTPGCEPDADHYVLHRATTAEDAADVRRMTPVATVAHDPAAATLAVTDDASGGAPPPARIDLRYRLTAVDRAGNESAPSRIVAARSFSTLPPPVPELAARRSPDGTRTQVRWTESAPDCAVLLQRQAGDAVVWQAVSTWLAADVREFADGGLDPASPYSYRLLVRNPSRVIAESPAVEVQP